MAADRSPPGVRERRTGGRVLYEGRIRRQGRSLTETFDNPADAHAWRASTIAALARGEEPASVARAPSGSPTLPRALTVADAARELVEGMVTGAVRTRRGHPFKPATIRPLENRLRLYVLPRIGRVPVAAVRRGDVRRLVDELAVDKSPATALNVRDALSAVMRLQLEREVIAANSCTGVKGPAVDRTPARFLSPEEADRLQLAADALGEAPGRSRNPLIGPFVALALGTGLRLGELQAQVWGPAGLDLDARVLWVHHTRDRTGLLVSPKSRRSREVPLSDDLVTRMREWRLRSGRPEDGQRVFGRSHRRAFEHARKAAGLGPPAEGDEGPPGLRVHDLRHTAATFWLAAGLTVHAVAELLGHVDAALVLRLYGHALPRERSSAGERLEAWRAAQRG